jgi:hypothetical protein
MPRVRDYSDCTGRELVRVEFLIPASLAKKLLRFSQRERDGGVTQARNHVVQVALYEYFARQATAAQDGGTDA